MYHVALEPKSGQDPALLGAPPMSPIDFAADSQEHALDQFASRIAACTGEIHEATEYTDDAAAIAGPEGPPT